MQEYFNIQLELNNENALKLITIMCSNIGINIESSNIELIPDKEKIVYYKINGINTGRVYIGYDNEYNKPVWKIDIYDQTGKSKIFKGIACSYYASIITELQTIEEIWVISPRKNKTMQQIVFAKRDSEIIQAESKTISYYGSHTNNKVGSILVEPKPNNDIDLVLNKHKRLNDFEFVSTVLKLSYYSYVLSDVYKDLFGNNEVFSNIETHENTINNYLLILESYAI